MLIQLFRVIFFIPFLLLISYLNVAANISYAQEKISLLTGLAKPPYILEDGQTGLQLDLIKEAFACKNIDVGFVNIPLGRNITSLKSMEVAGMITLPANFDYPGIFLSKPYIIYQNVAIHLADKRFKIEKMADLSLMSIGAFQNARKFISDDYTEAVSSALEYREIADQNEQITMLFERSVEVIILDINIFKYFLKLNKDKIYQKPIMIKDLFVEQAYSIGFKTKKLRDIFNEGLACIKNNGSYQATYVHYSD